MGNLRGEFVKGSYTHSFKVIGAKLVALEERAQGLSEYLHPYKAKLRGGRRKDLYSRNVHFDPPHLQSG